MSPVTPELLTAREAAEILQVTPHHVRYLIRTKQLRPLREDPFIFDRADVEALAAERAEKPNGRRRRSSS